MSRESVSQQRPNPEGNYTGFPARTIRQGTRWRRGHKKENSPWYYDAGQDGRFNLREPAGTCYLANTDTVAAHECIGPDFLRAGAVNEKFVATRVVSQLVIPNESKLAKLTSDDAFGFGISNELCSISDYSVTRAWAAVFHESEFNGVWYHPRFSPGSKSRAIGLFGAAGQQAGEVLEQKPLTAVLKSFNFPVLETDRLDGYEIIDS